MKALFKTVSVTLVISVAMLFFSSSGSNKVEAAGAGAVISAAAAVSVIGSMIIGIATYLGDKLPVVNVKDFVNSPDFESSISVSEDGTAIFNPPSPFPSKINETVFNATAREAVKEYNSQLRVYVCGTGGSPEGGGKNRIPGSVFNAAVSAAILGALASEALADPDNPTGSTAGITLGISTVNGKPQKVTTTYMESTVDVFDYLDLNYKIVNDISDIMIETSTSRYSGYFKPFIITKDNKMYSMDSYIYFSYKIGVSSYVYLSIYNYTESYSISIRGDIDSYRAFKFYVKDGILSCAFYLSTVDSSKQLSRRQFIVSSPKLESYPVLFSDKLIYDKISSTNFQNDLLTKEIKFNCNLDDTFVEGNDILSLDVASVGYFIGNPDGATLSTAAKMLTGTENPVQGGTNTTYSDLSDIEKAIYALSKQQGITYEEMLEQSNLVIENGQIYLEGLDGVTHSIESLLSEFDKLLEQGDITNENIAASTEQLKAILEYLKGLNIEGLGEYIQQLETTLDGLKQGDEDREAILGDVLGQLQGLNDYINSLDIESIGANIKSITDSLSDFITAFKDTLFDGMTAPKVSFDYTPGDIIEHYTEQFPLYEQCKKLINNLFNYDDVLEPPNFSFYWDSDGDGVKEVYNPFDFSILETKLTNENMVDKSIFAVEIKVIDLIRYILAVIIYGFFVMRLIRRLPTLYGSGPFASM